MKCPVCGAESRELARQHKPFMTTIVRTCVAGHRFGTYEVHKTQLADKREMDYAIRNIKRRVDMFHRNRAIMGDPRPTKEVAKDYGLTETRVRQIRASNRSDAVQELEEKIASQT